MTIKKNCSQYLKGNLNWHKKILTFTANLIWNKSNQIVTYLSLLMVPLDWCCFYQVYNQFSRIWKFVWNEKPCLATQVQSMPGDSSQLMGCVFSPTTTHVQCLTHVPVLATWAGWFFFIRFSFSSLCLSSVPIITFVTLTDADESLQPMFKLCIQLLLEYGQTVCMRVWKGLRAVWNPNCHLL